LDGFNEDDEDDDHDEKNEDDDDEYTDGSTPTALRSRPVQGSLQRRALPH
jgi:hypothetical protein